jgi:hypothetical protein
MFSTALKCHVFVSHIATPIDKRKSLLSELRCRRTGRCNIEEMCHNSKKAGRKET